MQKIEGVYVDIPQLAETFSDRFGTATFDGKLLRIEFQVIRMDHQKPQEAPTVKIVPACRLVIPTGAMMEIYNALQGIVEKARKQGGTVQ